MSFSGKVVIITGGSGGIGASIAIEFAKEGANVVIVGRNQTKLEKVFKECVQHGPNPLMIKADVSKDEDAKDIIRRTVDVYGKIDVLVNNAGIIKAASILKENFITSFDDIMKINVRAVANLTYLAAPHLVATKGNIINISSIAGTKTSLFQQLAKQPGFASYGLSKAALNHFTTCIALELSMYGVRVNAVSPGPVKTDIFNVAGLPQAIESLSKETALGGACETEEIAELVLFLASDKARSITGSNYVIDRGFTLK